MSLLLSNLKAFSLSLSHTHTHTRTHARVFRVVTQPSVAPYNSSALAPHRARYVHHPAVIILLWYMYTKLYGVTFHKSAVLTYRLMEYTHSRIRSARSARTLRMRLEVLAIVNIQT
jgi:hypothetical protein